MLFQQLHYYDTPSLVRSLRAGRWAEVLSGSLKVEPVSDAWCVGSAACAVLHMLLLPPPLLAPAAVSHAQALQLSCCGVA